ncbi:transposase [Candidatus Parcubacteria bacterium]|nr:transposase [Patescibacteria group bacterium]MBU4380603.1 transposase [Patescibacteria group bacterium]MCG2689531.1 transposase [Candidatus Parcubacteria bacterium]
MPQRLLPLVESEIYHVFNRGIENRVVFEDEDYYFRATQAINFYRYYSPPIKLTQLLALSTGRYIEVMDFLASQNELLIDILAYCLMPNHFHFLLRQKRPNGIALFLANFQNSYTRYFNTRKKRRGPIFLTQFKAKLIKNEGQLLHVSRYIHLNPYSARITETKDELKEYPWSSFTEYIENKKDGICEKETILSHFKTSKRYEIFVFDNADYQRTLQGIKSLLY